MDQIPATWAARLPLPPGGLSPNGRLHWASRRRLATSYVTRCLAALREQGIFPPREAWPRVSVSIAFYVVQVGDLDNRVASLKSLIDALVRAGYFAGDDPSRLGFAQWPTQERVAVADSRLELTVTAVA